MSDTSISVLVCDDQAVVREGLAAILSTAPTLEVTALAANGQETLDLLARELVDVVLMDLNMPVLNGVQATRLIKKHFPGVAVLVLTTYASDDWLFDALRAGATGYLLKDTRREDLVRAVEQAAQGKAQLSPEVASRLMEVAAQVGAEKTPLLAELTPRERDVLRLLTEGHSNAAIAEVLGLSPGTVRNYVSEILAKLGVSDRTQAAVVAVKGGLLR